MKNPWNGESDQDEPCRGIVEFDRVGNWSEIKLEIIEKYAAVYSLILSNHDYLHHAYIDGFCGPGINFSRESGEIIAGSPLIAMNIDPPFEEYYFVDMDPAKVDYLKMQVSEKDNAYIFEGDCNQILLDDIFPQIRFKDYKRALCLLDPYGLQLDWAVIEMAGNSKAIDIFINFPVVDANRNVIWKNPDKVSAYNLERMSRFWGDDSWKKVAYHEEQTLFGTEKVKNDNDVLAEGFRERLKEVAGFKYVPDPVPMKNSNNSTVYYLFLASQKKVAGDIITDIFNKYR